MKKQKVEVCKLGGAFFVAIYITEFFKFFKGKTGSRLYVVSAVKGITRLLEIIFKISIQKDISFEFKKKLIDLSLDEFKKIHEELIIDLFDENQRDDVLDDFNSSLVELRETVFSSFEDEDQYCASILMFGELASSKILGRYLLSIGINNTWFDARNYVVTDNNYRNAKIILIRPDFENNFSKSEILITQGFIGKSITGKFTVTGYDGSDESAARFAITLSDKYETSINFRKDVLGVYNGDPRKEKKLELYSTMTPKEYLLLVEETNSYVIRPDSILDLSGKNIIVTINSYIDLENPGTVIHD